MLKGVFVFYSCLWIFPRKVFMSATLYDVPLAYLNKILQFFQKRYQVNDEKIFLFSH